MFINLSDLGFTTIVTNASCDQILLAIMSGAFGLAGYNFGNPSNALHPSTERASLLTHNSLPARKPTSSSSEAPVSMAPGSMPWQTDSKSHSKNSDEHAKYQYHPGGDPSKAPKDAPSALNSGIVPNVTLPKVSRLSIYGYI